MFLTNVGCNFPPLSGSDFQAVIGRVILPAYPLNVTWLISNSQTDGTVQKPPEIIVEHLQLNYMHDEKKNKATLAVTIFKSAELDKRGHETKQDLRIASLLILKET